MMEKQTQAGLKSLTDLELQIIIFASIKGGNKQKQEEAEKILEARVQKQNQNN